MFEDTTIILQGIINDAIPLRELLEKYMNISSNIIITIYENQYEKAKPIIDNFPTVRVILNKENVFIKELTSRNIPARTTTDELYHCYFQIMCILKALKEVSTPFVLFCRIDHSYSNLDSFIRIGQTEKKFVTSSFVVRGLQIPAWRAHFSDCLFFGETEQIRCVLTTADRNYIMENLNYKPPESRIWAPYFTDKLKEEGINLKTCSNDEYVRALAKYMNIVPIHDLIPFKIKAMNRIWQDNDLYYEKQNTEHYLHNGMKF